MAERQSTGMRNFKLQHGSVKKAIDGGVIKIYSGSQPASPDSPMAGTLLCTLTAASGARTDETRAEAQITLGGSSGDISSIEVGASEAAAVEILNETVTFTTDLTTTAAAVAQSINAKQSVPKYEARSSGANVIIKAMPRTGTTPNLYSISCTVSTMTATVVSFGSNASLQSGVSQSNGLLWGSVVSGVLYKSSQVWSGVNVASGTAGCFRICSTEVDANGTSTTALRIDGSIATSGADVTMLNTSLTSGATTTVSSFSVTDPAS